MANGAAIRRKAAETIQFHHTERDKYVGTIASFDKNVLACTAWTRELPALWRS